MQHFTEDSREIFYLFIYKNKQFNISENISENFKCTQNIDKKILHNYKGKLI